MNNNTPQKWLFSYRKDPTLEATAKKILFVIEQQQRAGYTQHFCTDIDEIVAPGRRIPQAKKRAWAQLQEQGYVTTVREYGSKTRAIVHCINKIVTREEYSEMMRTTPSEDGHYVYLVRRRGDGIYKIGMTETLARRINTIATSCGSFVDLISHADVKNHDEIERMLHRQFKEKNIIGEWFSLSLDDVNAIEEVFMRLTLPIFWIPQKGAMPRTFEVDFNEERSCWGESTRIYFENLCPACGALHARTNYHGSIWACIQDGGALSCEACGSIFKILSHEPTRKPYKTTIELIEQTPIA